MKQKIYSVLALAILSCLLAVAGYAQGSGTRITGTVIDESGNPLAGTTIQLKGETRGALTGKDGKYEIMTKPTDILVFSFVGYDNEEILTGTKTVVDVIMKMKANEMEGVVVAAFGVQKKASVVSSIESIVASDLRIPSSNLTAALAGRAAGLVSMQTSGEPGNDNANFFIRGVTTFGYATGPLIILDGFEVSTDVLARVDPDNIESFSILKDATAAALYGSKGANGVLEVMTKKGKEGPVKLMFRYESRFSTPTQLPKFVDGITYMNLYNEAELNDNPNTGGGYYTPQKIENTIRNVSPYAFPNVDWYKEMFNKVAYNQYFTLNLSGGGKLVNYYTSASYTHENGLMKNLASNKFNNNITLNRYNLLMNMDFKLTRTTTLSANMSSIFQNSNGPNTKSGSDIYRSVIKANPVDFPKYYLPDEFTQYENHTLFGSLEGMSAGYNPYAEMVSGYYDGFSYNVISQFTLNQDLGSLVKGLSIKAKFAIGNDGSYSNTRYRKPYYYTMANYNDATNTYKLKKTQTGDDVMGDPKMSKNTKSHNYFEGGMYYNNGFGNHDVTGVVIYTQEEKTEQAIPSRNQAVRARVTYGFGGRYLAEASLTYQGSEKFYGSKKWGTFPSVAVGYMISNEKFWKPLSKVVNKLKFKASYGVVGNDNITPNDERFFFLSSISQGELGFVWGKDFSNGYNTYKVTRYPNPDITWEMAYKQNFGFEMELWNFATIQLDYFREHRKNIYMARNNIPYSMGMTASINGNTGEAKSDGLDGSLDLKHFFTNDFWITGRFNFTYTKNRLVVIDEKQYKDKYLSRVGMDMNQVQGYIAERLFIDQQDIDNSPLQSIGKGEIRPGDIKYKDINGDGVVDTNDQVPIGYSTANPGWNYGFGMSIGYKGFDMSCFFQGISRITFFMDIGDMSPFINHANALQFIADDHWSSSNPVSNPAFPRLSTAYNENNYTRNSTWWMRDGSLLRLKTAELGYTIPANLTTKWRIDNLRFYVSGQNLLCFKNFKLWDPEMGTSGLGYPLQRVFSIGVNVNF